MEQVTLIQCTKSKRDEAAKAKNLYDTSAYFRAMRSYAEAVDNDYCILSAKHGLLSPDDTIEPYDEVGLSEEQCEDISSELVNAGVGKVRLIAGREYSRHLIPELESEGIDVVEVCCGMQIGERMQRLNTLSRNKRNQSL